MAYGSDANETKGSQTGRSPPAAPGHGGDPGSGGRGDGGGGRRSAAAAGAGRGLSAGTTDAGGCTGRTGPVLLAAHFAGGFCPAGPSRRRARGQRHGRGDHPAGRDRGNTELIPNYPGQSGRTHSLRQRDGVRQRPGHFFVQPHRKNGGLSGHCPGRLQPALSAGGGGAADPDPAHPLHRSLRPGQRRALPGERHGPDHRSLL